jgi:two-component system, cell cycle response regulator CtrA
MRVLLVEDDAATAASIKMMLNKENYNCDTTALADDGLEIGKLYDYDIILLDLMHSDIDGYEVLRRLRTARVCTPILILSRLAELDYKFKGLGFGADDFLTKPFDRRELIARIQATVRHSKGHAESLIGTGKLAVKGASCFRSPWWFRGTRCRSQAGVSTVCRSASPRPSRPRCRASGR